MKIVCSIKVQTEEILKNRYIEMLYPSEEEWRLKAVEDFKRGADKSLESSWNYSVKG